MLSIINQTQRQIACHLSYMWNLKDTELEGFLVEDWLSGGEDKCGEGRHWLKDIKFQLVGKNKFW